MEVIQIARLSILGLYTFDPTIFENMQVPAGLDKTMVTDNILMDLAELEVIYTDSSFMKRAIEHWSKTEIKNWQRIYDAYENTDYVAGENYNRTDTIHDVTLRKDNTKDATTRDTKTSEDHSGTNTESTGITGTNIQTRQVAGFNETVPQTAEIIKDTPNQETDVIKEYGEVVTTSNTGTDTRNIDVDGNENYSRNLQSRGNIGVTSTQELITQEIELRAFNITEYITHSFKYKFCVMVY